LHGPVGGWNRWERDPGSDQRAPRAPQTRRSVQVSAGCCGPRSKKVTSGEKPFMFLDEAHARSKSRGPATMDGHRAGGEGLGILLDGEGPTVSAGPRERPWAAGGGRKEIAAGIITHGAGVMFPFRHASEAKAIPWRHGKEKMDCLRRFGSFAMGRSLYGPQVPAGTE